MCSLYKPQQIKNKKVMPDLCSQSDEVMFEIGMFSLQSGHTLSITPKVFWDVVLFLLHTVMSNVRHYYCTIYDM